MDVQQQASSTACVGTIAKATSKCIRTCSAARTRHLSQRPDRSSIRIHTRCCRACQCVVSTVQLRCTYVFPPHLAIINQVEHADTLLLCKECGSVFQLLLQLVNILAVKPNCIAELQLQWCCRIPCSVPACASQHNHCPGLAPSSSSLMHLAHSNISTPYTMAVLLHSHVWWNTVLRLPGVGHMQLWFSPSSK